MKSIPKIEATVPQLARFATEVLGLDGITARTTKPELLARIGTVHDEDTILFEGAEEAPAALQDAAPRKINSYGLDRHDSDDKVTVFINAEKDDETPVRLGVNGVVMLVERGKEQRIPRAFYESLKNARMVVQDPLPNGGMSEPRYVNRFSFSAQGV